MLAAVHGHSPQPTPRTTYPGRVSTARMLSAAVVTVAVYGSCATRHVEQRLEHGRSTPRLRSQPCSTHPVHESCGFDHGRCGHSIHMHPVPFRDLLTMDVELLLRVGTAELLDQ